MGDHLATPHAGTGAEIDDGVGLAHRFFIMLDDDHRVSLIPQLQQRIEQHAIVSRMETDRRFIEDVEDADETAADLSCQPNALRLAATERGGRPIESQIPQTAIEQEPQPTANLLEGFGSDQRFGLRHLDRLKESSRLTDRQRAHFRQTEGTPAPSP